jgi:hypothetical protein
VDCFVASLLATTKGGRTPSVIASEAKQPRAACGLLRRFAPRNDKGRALRSSQRQRAGASLPAMTKDGAKNYLRKMGAKIRKYSTKISVNLEKWGNYAIDLRKYLKKHVF